MYRRFFFIIALMVCALSAYSQTWSVTSSRNVYNYDAVSFSGLDKVYILFNENDLRMEFSSFIDDPISIYTFDGFGGLQQIQSIQNGNTAAVVNPRGNTGYYIMQNGAIAGRIWVVTYSPLYLHTLRYDESSSDCDLTRLLLDYSAEDMSYYSVSGNKYTIQRNISVNYDSKKWDDQNFFFITDAVISQEKLSKELNVTAPYADTYFTVTGDQFMDFWSETTSVSTDDLYQAIAVIGKATATQNVRDAANELDSQSGELSGSAPIDIEFSGYANYPVVTYQAWEISKDREFNLIEATYNEQDLVYSFIEEGTTYVRYVISNADSSCESIVETFTVNTSESSLEVPNVFTPGSPSGNNLEFRVAYRSIVKFEAWIFNRWGNELFHWTDPSKGWDGKYKGKLVPTGAYYYVIKAEGVGGKKYNLKGDINVIRTNK